MSIWFQTTSADVLNKIGDLTMSSHLNIEITEVGDDYIRGTMPVDYRTVQPFRVLHGGASAALAETLGSVGAQMTVDSTQKRCVGMALNVNHIRPIREGGKAIGTATVVHLGKSTQVWDIQIKDQAEKLISTARLTLAILSITAG